MKMDLREIGLDVDRIHLIQYRDQCRCLMRLVMNFRVP